MKYLNSFRNNLIVIPFNLPWEWSTDYTNQTAFVLGNKNTVICYMWGETYSVKEYLLSKHSLPKLIKKAGKNIYLIYPTQWIPFKRNRWIGELNEKLNLAILNLTVFYLNISGRYRQKIFWNFDPNLFYLAGYLKGGWLTIYDCVDYFSGALISRQKKRKVLENEEKTVKQSDLVTANSTVLVKHLSKFGKDIPLVPQGFRYQSFLKYSKNFPQLKKPGRPLIGFLGAVNHRLDYALLYKLAVKHPAWDFAVWGPLLETEKFTPEKMDLYSKLIKMSNVITGKSGKAEVPGIIKQFDVGIIPYDSTLDFNKYCHPMKIFEYFFAGIPVVSTEIEELKRFPGLVKISDVEADWDKYINELLSNKWASKYKYEQRKLSIENSWENKINNIIELINKVNSPTPTHKFQP